MVNLSLEELFKIKLVSLSKAFFRLVALKHAEEILSPQGSLKCGGRYNPAKKFGALYLGESENVCKTEKYVRAKPDLLDSQILGEIRVSLKKVLDLTNINNLKKLGIKKEDLMYKKSGGGWNLTCQIARLAYQMGIEAILAPSSTGEGDNLVVFDKHIKEDKVKLISKKEI